MNKVEVWMQRQGQSIVEQGQRGLEVRGKLKGYFPIVKQKSLSGKTSTEGKMRCAIGIIKDVIK